MPRTTVRCEWTGGLQRFYMSDTFETVNVHAAGKFIDDFCGTATLVDGSTEWSSVIVGAGTVTRVADGENGQVSLLSTAAAAANDAVLYWGNEHAINVKDGAIIEMRVRPLVLPATNAAIVFGVAGDHDLDKDTITEGAWFKLDGATTGSLLVCETDDTINNNDDVTTGVTVATGTWYVCRIDTTNINDVKFYVNGVSVGGGTTFDMSNLSDAAGTMQPYMSVDKPADGSVGTLLVDYFKAWWNRA